MVILEYPRLLPQFTVIPLDDARVLLHSLTHSLEIKSDTSGFIPRLLSLLDGRHSLDALMAELEDYDRDEVVTALEQLHESGLVEAAEAEADPALSVDEYARYADQMVFFSHFIAAQPLNTQSPWPDIPRRAVDYQLKLRQSRVLLFGLGRLGSQVTRLLTLSGVGQLVGLDDAPVSARDVHSDAWYSPAHLGQSRADVLADQVKALNPWVTFTPLRQPLPETADAIAGMLDDVTLVIVCTDDIHPDLFARVNEACLHTNTVWTSCRLSGFEFTVGPTVIPFETPCYTCFEQRLASNAANYEEHQIITDYQRHGRLHAETLTITPGIGLVALEAVKAITYFMEPATYAHLYALNLLTLESKLHPILKIPRCPACGRPTQTEPMVHFWQHEPVQEPAHAHTHFTH